MTKVRIEGGNSSQKGMVRTLCHGLDNQCFKVSTQKNPLPCLGTVKGPQTLIPKALAGVKGGRAVAQDGPPGCLTEP